MNKLIVYGDIHGCYDELIALRTKINPQLDDIEVCVGDIITKGKDSLKTLKYIQAHAIQSILGNHEEKIVRYLKYDISFNENPISLNNDEQKIVDNLDTQDIEFLTNLPLFLKFQNITILHGGLQNHHDLNEISKKEKGKILRMRYLDKEDDFITYGKEDKESIFWADVYNGNQGFIVYGHQWFNEVKTNKHAIGIDTGCVYGNKLSAVIIKNCNTENILIESINANLSI